MAVLPNGQRRWPSIELAGTEGIDHFPPISQFQFIQRNLERMELLLVAPRRLTEPEEKMLRGWVDEAVGYPFQVTITYVDNIPRSSAGKFEDFRCEVPDEVAARTQA